MTKTVLIVLAVLAGSCCLLGGAVMVLGFAADDEPATASPAAPASAPSGEHPKELVGFWSGAAHKLALFPDGTAKRWFRYYWSGKYGSSTCKLEGDMTGTWSVSGQTLTVEVTDGRWRDCTGDRDFEPSAESWQFRQEYASGIGKMVMWLKDDKGESGLNLECESPSGCSFEPKPLE